MLKVAVWVGVFVAVEVAVGVDVEVFVKVGVGPALLTPTKVTILETGME